MPGRQYTQQKSSSSQNRPKKTKTAKRALNAFSIARHGAPEDYKPRRSRLGEVERDNIKRRRDDSEDEGDDDDEEEAPKHKKLRHGGKDKHGNEIDGGSDSEGNEWVTGVVASDDDSSLDSDEAMGDSDEEKFADFKFSGSSGSKSRKKPSRARDLDETEIDLNEGDDREYDSGEESEDFAANAIDLADVLDQDSEEEEPSKKRSHRQQDDDDDDLEDFSDEADFEEEDDFGMSDIDEDANDPAKLSALQTLLSSMDNGNGKKSARSQLDLAQEAVIPSEYGLTSKQKLSVSDLLATVTDPTLRKSLKLLASDGKKSSKKSGVPGKLSAPLPQRQQDRIDRAAAFDQSKETLDRWIDTVKHNRRAEHLVFPLVDQDVEAAKTTKRLLPVSEAKPANDLEATIQKILIDSGLTGEGKKQDDEIQKFEEVATNKLPIEEVRARQAELRQARDLLFREEIRAKRIKKIKSKSYRRVHRKEREKNLLREQEAMAEAGIVPSEDEQERMDRRRAEERMGQRHRESRWAKGVKGSGRAAWDDDARDGVSAMLRQDEELKRRMHGKDVQEDNSESDEDTEDSEEDEEAFTKRMHAKISQIKNNNAGRPESKLSSMKFMQKAEAARRAQNNEALDQLQREFDGGSEMDENSNDEGEGAGRRKFGPRSKITTAIKPKEVRSEFEEGHGSEDDDTNAQQDDEDVEIIVNGKSNTNGTKQSSKKPVKFRPLASTNAVKDPEEENPWLTVPKKSKKNTAEASVVISTTPKLSDAKAKSGPKMKPKQAAITMDEDEDSDDSFGGFSPPPTTKTPLDNQALIRQAFAADDVLAEENFATEKKALASDEEPDKTVSGGLAGWGSWIGPGLTKREKKEARNTRQATSKPAKNSPEGVLAEQRKDKNLDKIIISEKRVAKTAKYLASSLPHPFESKAQYERSLRLPMGPEFTTKTTFQGMTKPRVIMKGGVVAPMRKPLM